MNFLPQSGKVNYFRALAGGYLCYLGGKLLIGIFRGEATVLWISIVGGVLFLGAGAAILWNEWKTYRDDVNGTSKNSEPETEEPDAAEAEQETLSAPAEEGGTAEEADPQISDTNE